MKKYHGLSILIAILVFLNTSVGFAMNTVGSSELINPGVLDAVLDLLKQQEEEKALQQRQQQEKERQELLEKLNVEVNDKTYLNYIKELGYYKKVYKDDEKLNIRNALLMFQSNHNMSVTGNWDAATKQMLIRRLSSEEFTYYDTVKTPPAKGKWIAVNTTNRTLTLYEDKEVLKKYAVAVGNPVSLTKSGKYHINMKIIDPDWGGAGIAKPVKGGSPKNPLGSRWLGINRTDGSYGIHGTNSFYSIGKYISLGCIRMSNYCVEELFPLVPMKTPVWVGSKAELEKWGVVQPEFKPSMP